ncbi:hypothetical protein [Caulobacter segnis]|uniref:hypothetical protein n=1 Tax=Caulobacter segnis TaxID=88688 RepID=UPI0026D2A6F5|nr:hypothetical protein [Caulobacter segnis]
MLALAVLVISALFVVAAMAGLADAIVSLACGAFGGLFGESNRQKPEQSPARRISA